MSGGSINWGGFNSDPQIAEAKNQASSAASRYKGVIIYSFYLFI